MKLALSFEDVGTFSCPPCPSPFTDDGRFIWITVGWLAIIFLLWPWRALQQRVPKNKQLQVSFVYTAIVTLIVIGISLLSFITQDKPNDLSISFSAFLAAFTFAQPANACLGCADLGSTVFNIMSLIVVPLYIISAIVILRIRVVVRRTPVDVPLKITPAAVTLLVCQTLVLAVFILHTLIR